MPNNEERNEYVEEPSPVSPETSGAPSPEAPAAEETPAEQTSAALAEEKPAEEKPAEEKPAEEKPAEEKGSASAEEKPFAHSPLHNAPTPEVIAKEAARAKRARRVRNTILAIVLAVSLLSVTLLGGFALGKMTMIPALPGATTTQNGGGDTPSKPSVDRGDLILNVVERAEGTPTPGSIASVVASIKDSVVEIYITQTAIDPFNGNYSIQGAGSGVLISSGNEKGLILTCSHLVEGADKNGITVELEDGRVFSGTQVELLGADSWSDLALLRIRDENGNEPANLTYATMATSGSANDYSYMTLGETVIAIGNPLGGLPGSVSAGIVSGFERKVLVDGMPMTLLQTDAATNAGNSGGGLFNMAGELVAIVNSGAAGSDVEGISYAIPTSDAIPIIGELYSQGYVSGRPFLGLYFTTTSGYFVVTDYLYNDELTGEYKIRSGDYLTHLNGVPVNSVSVILTTLVDMKVGDTLTATFVRITGYRQETFTVTLTIHENTP